MSRLMLRLDEPRWSCAAAVVEKPPFVWGGSGYWGRSEAALHSIDLPYAAGPSAACHGWPRLLFLGALLP